MDKTMEIAMFLIGAEQVSDLLSGFVAFAEQDNATGFEIEAIGKPEMAQSALGYPARVCGNGVLNQERDAGAVGVQPAMRNSHVCHFVECKEVFVLEKNRKHP